MHFPHNALSAYYARFEGPLLAGFVVVFLLHFYLVSHFAIPSLRARERKRFVAGMIGAFALFVGAVLVAYTHILPPVIARIGEEPADRTTCFWKPLGFEDNLAVGGWLCFGFGVLCEFPIVATLIGLFGLISSRWLSRTRPHAYTVLLVIAAILTPTPDLTTFFTLSVPVILLYEVCCGIVWLFDRRARREAISALV